jgi:hypothetical protein
MKINLLLIVVLYFLSSCTSQKISNEIRIEGQVEGLPNGKIYLTEAHAWDVPLDSTTCIDGHFVFMKKIDSSFVPFMASISYPDSASPTKIGQLMFSNDFLLPPDTAKFYNYHHSGFFSVSEWLAFS